MKKITFEEMLDMTLTERQVEIAAGVHRPRKISRQEIEDNFLEVFELVGGVPRLAMWANEPSNYGEFIKIIGKLLPKVPLSSQQAMIYQSLVPRSKLNENVVDLHNRLTQEQAEQEAETVVEDADHAED